MGPPPKVKIERLLGAVFATLLFPGFGQGLAGKRWHMIVWMAVGVIVPLSILISMWSVYLTYLVRLASATDAFIRLRRVAASPRPHRTLAAIAMAGGAICFGYLSFGFEAFRFPTSSMYPTLEIGDYLYVEKISKLWRAPQHGDVIVFRKPCELDRDYIKRVIAVAGDTVEIRCGVVYVNATPVPSVLVEGDTCSYEDFREGADGWTRESCSRYREALDGVDYDVFHDAERPARDAKLRANGTLTAEDLGYHTEKEFPKLGGLGDSPPRCSPDGGDDPEQQPGTVVRTKANAGVCELQLHYVVPADSLFVLGDNRWNSNDSRFWGAVPVSYVKGRVIGIWLGRDGQRFSRIGPVH